MISNPNDAILIIVEQTLTHIFESIKWRIQNANSVEVQLIKKNSIENLNNLNRNHKYLDIRIIVSIQLYI